MYQKIGLGRTRERVKTTTRALLVALIGGVACADDTPAPTSNFLSSLKQSFTEDYAREVVRGHFDVGAPPNAHRYYCLIDPKTGKAAENGIAGTLVPRRDGTRGIEGASVSFYSCVDAESKGLLVTSEYRVNAQIRGPIPAPAPAPAPAAAPAPAPSLAAAPMPGVAPDLRPLKSAATDPMTTLQTFIEAYNQGDAEVFTSLLADSGDFAWVQPDGRTAWGRAAAVQALQASRSDGSQWQLEPEGMHTLSLTPKTAILITKLQMTRAGKDPRMIRCSSVIVPTPKGWRIVSLFMTPER
jgi:Domain of unknown function (DUF4440)